MLILLQIGFSKSNANSLSLLYNGWLPAINVVDNYIYLSDYSTGLSVIEIGDDSLRLTQIHNRQQEIQFLLPIESGNMYAYYGSDTLALYSISEPLSPVINLPGYRSDIGMPYGMVARDSVLYIAGNHPFGGEGEPLPVFEIVDFSSPTAPQTLFAEQAINGLGGIAFAPNSSEFLVVSEAGLISWNISDPLNPIRVDTLAAIADYIISWQDLLFLRIGESGTSMTSVDNVGYFTEPNTDFEDFFADYNFQLLCAGDQYLIGYENESIFIFESSIENQPLLRSNFIQTGLRKIFTNDEVLITSTTDSLFVYHLSDVVSIVDRPTATPDYFELFNAYPNPFNPSTTIEYALHEKQKVHLTIFDLNGRIVRNVFKESQLPGLYEIVWNGIDTNGNSVSTGVYLARLQAGEYTQTIKIVLLR